MIIGAVLGSPITHSLSPVLHKAAFDFLGIEGSYSAIEVTSGSLGEFMTARAADFDYLSLTMPLKEEVLALDVAKDVLTDRIQSGNTLIQRQGAWSLTSTDGSGLVAALAHAGFTTFKSVLILGAGGTARAVAGALDSVTDELHVLGRSSVRESALQSAVQRASFQYLSWNSDIDFDSYDLIVNTTPAGAADLLANAAQPNRVRVLFDVIYKPWPTELAKRWNDCGGTVINGLELLLYQGIDQLELVLSQPLDRLALANHIRPLLQRASR